MPPKGLSEDARRKLQQSRDCANQILKAAMAINSDVLAEMEIPEVYLETLPKVKYLQLRIHWYQPVYLLLSMWCACYIVLQSLVKKRTNCIKSL